MDRRETSAVIIQTTGVLAAVISIVTLLSTIWVAKWQFFLLLPIGHIFLHIDLWLLFYSSRVYRDMKAATLLVIGIISVTLSGYFFVDMNLTFWVIPTPRTGLYMLSFPVSVLFLIGVIMRRKSHSSE